MHLTPSLDLLHAAMRRRRGVKKLDRSIPERYRGCVPATLLVLLALAVTNVQRAAAAQPDSATLNVVMPGADTGQSMFEQRCGVCHGMNGGGGRGPNLRTPVLQHASDVTEIVNVIKSGIAPDMPSNWQYSEAELKSLATYVSSLGHAAPSPLPGDPARGAAVFQESGCSGCHILGGQGNGYGPELTSIGAARSVERLRQTLVDPAASLAPEFLVVEAVTESGETIQGIRRNEDTVSIQIQDAAGRFYSLDKSRLRGLKRLHGETPMPAFAGRLSQQQLDDLVSYLAVQRHTS